MRSQHPSVTCGAPLTPIPLVPDSFEYLANAFPASRDLKVFGRDSPSQAVDVPLPWEMRCPFHEPALKAVDAIVQTNGGSDTSSWSDIYIALITIWSMCGTEGRGGIAKNLGKLPRWVAVVDAEY